jgi:alpha-aminoadipate carrier protein LysW
VLCPECEYSLDIDAEEVDEGEIVSCPECGTDYEVITTHPLELNRLAAEEEEEELKEEEESENGDHS